MSSVCCPDSLRVTFFASTLRTTGPFLLTLARRTFDHTTTTHACFFFSLLFFRPCPGASCFFLMHPTCSSSEVASLADRARSLHERRRACRNCSVFVPSTSSLPLLRECTSISNVCAHRASMTGYCHKFGLGINQSCGIDFSRPQHSA